MSIEIRAERSGDELAIAAVHEHAFGRAAEADLVAALRASDAWIPALSLVAIAEGRVVGHVLFTRCIIEPDEDQHGQGITGALALAPVAVEPAWQCQGIGAALIRHGLDACRQAGFGLVIVLGHASYYPRFGFVQAHPYGIHAPFPVDHESFMLAELTPGAARGVSGTVRYPPAFDSV